MGSRIRVCLLAACFVTCVPVSKAAIITFQDGQVNAFNGWAISAGVGSQPGVLSTGVGGAGVPVGTHNNAGEVTANPGNGPDVDWLYNAAGLAGNYLNFSGGGEVIRGLSLEFYSYQSIGTSSADFRLYMLANGHTWYYDIGPVNAGWNQLYANMTHIDNPLFVSIPGWYSMSGFTMADFQSDLASVTRIGFELRYTANELNTYGFDYIGLYDNYFVPEPETYMVLAVALASLAFVFREQLRATLGTLMASARV